MSHSLIDNLSTSYPHLRFQKASVSRWSPSENTVYYAGLRSSADRQILLHELGHALSGHTSYDKDIELIKLEREAWRVARDLAPHYSVDINPELVEEHLDSYRDWLHARSRCPHCHSPGVQRHDGEYHCVLCDSRWTANDARQCGLKRYTKTPL